MTKTFATSIVIALASLAAGQAMATTVMGIDYEALRADMNTPSTVTREQVKAEFLADRAAHKNDVIEPTTGVNLTELNKQTSPTEGKTREQVKAEFLADRAAHKDDVIEPISGVNLTELRKQMGQTDGKTRAQVRAELMESLRKPTTLVN